MIIMISDYVYTQKLTYDLTINYFSWHHCHHTLMASFHCHTYELKILEAFGKEYRLVL